MYKKRDAHTKVGRLLRFVVICPKFKEEESDVGWQGQDHERKGQIDESFDHGLLTLRVLRGLGVVALSFQMN